MKIDEAIEVIDDAVNIYKEKLAEKLNTLADADCPELESNIREEFDKVLTCWAKIKHIAKSSPVPEVNNEN